MRSIIFDMDEVLVQFLKQLVIEYNDKYNTHLRVPDIVTWHLPKEIREIYYRTNFFTELKPYLGAVQVAERLQEEGHKIYIATDAGGDYHIADCKLRWIAEHMPFIDRQYQVIITGAKHLLQADVIVEDGPTNLERFKGATIAIDRPYNMSTKTDFRIYDNNFTEIHAIVNTLDLKGDKKYA